MKAITLCLIIGSICSQFCHLRAQNLDADWDLLLIREDHVKPPLASEYEASLMDLKLFFESQPENDYNYFIFIRRKI